MATGTFARVAKRAAGRGPTPRGPGITATRAAAAAAAAIARQGREGGCAAACRSGCNGRGVARWCSESPATVRGPAVAPAGLGPARWSPTVAPAPLVAPVTLVCFRCRRLRVGYDNNRKVQLYRDSISRYRQSGELSSRQYAS